MLCSQESTALYILYYTAKGEDMPFLCQRDTCSALISEWHFQFIQIAFSSNFRGNYFSSSFCNHQKSRKLQ